MLAEEHVHFMFTRGAWDNISCDRLAVEEDLADSLAYAVRILDRDLVNRTTEAAPYRIFLP